MVNGYWRDCDHCGKEHTGTVTAKDGSQICAHCAEQLYWSAWQALAERALHQLEEEHHRAVIVSAGWLRAIEAREKAEAELAALRGEQGHGDTMVYMMPNVFASLVNTAWDVALEYKNAQCLRDALSRELKGYFTLTRQPKPVVVLSDCDIGAVSHMAHWYSEEQCEAWVAGVDHAKRQMQAAGIVVKDGE